MKNSHWDPERDGIDHINVYSKGRTEVGRALSNFAHTPFEHRMYGRFASMEGYWYWLLTGRKHDNLRNLWGYLAKKVGRQLPYENPFTQEQFKDEILDGMLYKLRDNPTIEAMLLDTTLPLVHYYVYGNKVVPTESGQFIIDWLERWRAKWL